ncbi:MAG: diguanylate cyclase, partial [Myxococcota bacterium]|nr:diguanylate cyclase [Myxococcota bacterium]
MSRSRRRDDGERSGRFRVPGTRSDERPDTLSPITADRETSEVPLEDPAHLASALKLALNADAPLSRLIVMTRQLPTLSAGLIALANSSRFGFRTEVASVRETVALLGDFSVREFVVCHGVRGLLARSRSGMNDAQFWADCFRRAIIAQDIADLLGFEDSFEAFVMGFSLDLGTIMLSIRQPSRGSQVQALREIPFSERSKQERSHFGSTRREFFLASPLARMFPSDIRGALSQLEGRNLGGDNVAHLARLGGCAERISDLVHASPKPQCLSTVKEFLKWMGIDERPHDILSDASSRTVEFAGEHGIELPRPKSLQQLIYEEERALERKAREREEESVTEEEKEQKIRVLMAARLQQEALSAFRDASKDELTGLDNRWTFIRHLERALTQEGRDGAVSVLLVDLDQFRDVVERHGRELSDGVLQAVGARLLRLVSRGQCAARIGGEEMALVLTDTSSTKGRVAAERVRETVGRTSFDVGGQVVRCTVTVGGATSQPG